mgnify:CR=1 FL=1
MSKLKTFLDAVIYYRGSNFVNGKHEQHHTHVISIHNTGKIGTAYASDIGMNAIICGIKTYNQCIDDMSTNYGRSSLKHLAIWQARLKESKEALDSIVNKPLVYTQEFRVTGGHDPRYQPCRVVYSGTKYTVLVNSDGREFSRKTSKLDIRDIDTRTKKEKAINALMEKSVVFCNNEIMSSCFSIAFDEWVGE